MCKNVNTCNNCGKAGHLFHQCKVPITSYGVILFRRNKFRQGGLEFLMIRRKNSFGFIDFMRGKYNVNDVEHLKIMFDEMSVEEKCMIMEKPFDTLWREMWGIPDDIVNNSHHKTEENMSRRKFECLAKRRSNSEDFLLDKNVFTPLNVYLPINQLKGNPPREDCSISNAHQCINTNYGFNDVIEKNSLREYVETSSTIWYDTEWEFPKGRKDVFEKDLECAVREFEEETGISREKICVVSNLLPFEEHFIGSNKKSYKYKYFLAQYNDTYDTNDTINSLNNFQPSEVSKMEWKTYDECMTDIRPYYQCKKQIITNIYTILQYNSFYTIDTV